MTIPIPEGFGSHPVAADTPMRTFIALCASAGLRLGEVDGIQVRNVGFVRKRLKVTRQVQRAPDATVEVRAQVRIRARSRPGRRPDRLRPEQVADVGTVDEEQRLFGQSSGPVHQNRVGYWWRKTLHAAGLRGIKLHDLHRFYSPGLIAESCDVVTVQRSLGHAKATTTLDTYAPLADRRGSDTSCCSLDHGGFARR